MNPSVTCFVLNWNSKEYLENCLLSLLASDYENVAYVLIDNASTDGSMDHISQQFPSVKIIRNRTNLGFAGGNNVGLKELESDIAILVNPDVVVDAQMISTLAASFGEDEQIGIAGCKTYYPGTRQIQHAGGTVSYPRGEPDHFGLGQEDEGLYDTIADVEYVTGAVFAIKRKILEEIGLFDSGFFLYYEEADLCLRARNAGYRVVLVPNASAEHIESAVAKKGSQFFHNQIHTSRWRYLLKHYRIADLLEDTFPAESEWIMRLDPYVLAAAQYAYQKTILNHHEIFDRRDDESTDKVSDVQRQTVAQGLEDLRLIAWERSQIALEDLEQLTNMAHIGGQPFRSTIPVIGPVVAGFRELWSRVAAKEFTLPLLDQQGAINQFNVEQLADAREQRAARDAKQIDSDRLLSELIREMASANEAMDQLIVRLERLEEIGKDDQEETAR